MKTKFVVLMLLLATVVAQAQTNNLTTLLQQGLFEEEANRNLDAAISDYQSLATQFDKDRKVAATAVFRLGECYRKLGRTNEAVAQYERVLRDFSDQPELAALSRQNLTGLGASPSRTELSQLPAVANTTLDNEDTEIRRIQAMLRNSPDLINASSFGGATPLQEAAAKGQLKVARFLLDHGARINAGSGSTPLIRAVDNGQKTMAELLLSRGADVNAKSRDVTPLFEAVSRGFTAVTEVLLANKADVNAPSTSSETTPLHVAATKGDTGLVKLLIAHGANVNARDTQGQTPLHLAANKGQTAAAKALLAAKADVSAKDNDGNTPLHDAAHYGADDIISLLLEHGAAVDALNDNHTAPLVLAVANRHTRAVKLLLEHKANPNLEGISPGYAPLGKNINRNYRLRPIAFAINRMDTKALGQLLDSGADPDGITSDFTKRPLFQAIDSGQAEAVKLLLQHKADPNQPDDNGNSPLMHARGQPDILKLLLAAGANPNLVDRSGSTPLCYAIRSLSPNKTNPFWESVRLLVENGADVNSQRKNGLTPFAMAVERGELKTADFLLAHGAKPNLPDSYGNTPLNMAVLAANPDMVGLLLTNKADVNIQNKTGMTALDLAKQGMQGSINPSVLMGWSNSGPRNVDSAAERKIAALLEAHGGLADLPKLDCIEVTRPSAGYSNVVFRKGTNDWNRFSLLELIAVQYGLLRADSAGHPSSRGVSFGAFGAQVYNIINPPNAPSDQLGFPDLKHIVIHRPAPDHKGWKSIPVDVAAILSSGDSSNDVWLQWGDAVEIPELDHPIAEKWFGFTRDEINALTKCLSREVTIVIQGKRTEDKLVPASSPVMGGPSFMLRPALDNSRLIRFSSDLTRVKVIRHDPKTGKTREWTLNCSDPNHSPNFWLRNGDVIEVPEK